MWLSLATGVAIGVICLLLLLLFSDPSGENDVFYSQLRGALALDLTSPDPSPTPDAGMQEWQQGIERSNREMAEITKDDTNPYLQPSFRDDAAPLGFYTPQPAP